LVTRYDKVVIFAYLAFVLGIGLVFRRLSKSTSDYFRAGGAMPWWITGVSAWIAGFSAWTFVGAAAKVYESGPLILGVYYPAVAALLVVYYYTGRRFRRMRVVTWMEGVRGRYGPATEQFYTWLKVPLTLLLSGVALNAIGVFMSSVFGTGMSPTLVVLGTVVTIVALVGGAWAVLASDFVQSLLIMTITVVVAVLALQLPGVGGVGGLVRRLPAAHFHPSVLERPWVIVLWVVAQSWFKFADNNGIESASMYLMAKSDRDARRMVLIPIVGTLVGPLIWFVPSLVATVTHPNLAAEFPSLTQPHEAAFVAVARDVMPVGMVGLLMCTMFGATLTSMDASLNKNVGVFVRSFYGPILAPRATDRHLLLVSKGSTLAFGAIVVCTAVFVNRVRTVNLFDLTNLLAATLLMPLSLPLVFGLFVRRTPDWIAGTTVAVGFVVTAAANRWFDAAALARALRWSTPASAHDAVDLKLVVVALTSGAAASAWYFAVAAVHRRRGTPPSPRLAAFLRNLDAPVDAVAEGLNDQDATIYTLMGRLCLTFGTFVLTLAAFVPNRPAGRLAFVFCGGAIFVAGYVLARQGKVLTGVAAAAAATVPVDAEMGELRAGLK
jgi:SSS family solute:Na+ symporter